METNGFEVLSGQIRSMPMDVPTIGSEISRVGVGFLGAVVWHSGHHWKTFSRFEQMCVHQVAQPGDNEAPLFSLCSSTAALHRQGLQGVAEPPSGPHEQKCSGEV